MSRARVLKKRMSKARAEATRFYLAGVPVIAICRMTLKDFRLMLRRDARRIRWFA